MNGKRWAALGIAAVLFFVSIAVGAATTLFTADTENIIDELFASESAFYEEVIEGDDYTNVIAVFDVEGTIQDTGEASLLSSATYNHRAFMDKLKMAEENDDIKGIILRVNSPGGGVVESAEIHEKILDIKKVKKPVYVSMGSMAASGGYYISAPADKIYASPETMTGSLGVIMHGYNYEKLAKKYGVEFETIKSGPHKDIMSPTREMTGEEREILQNMINNSYDQFVKVIADGRGMTEKEVREIADGRIYDGRQAKENHLIDDFGHLDDVIAAMKTDIGKKDAQVIRYTDEAGFGSLFSMGAQKMLGNDVETAVLTKILSSSNSPRLMYLYAE
ncbi:signal peptide peptidase SppA [Peribacillus frigoritolerans]|jgi:protease IV|uniref:signal peptide peptidase SppA n=1 Tax=Peribacillus TaxID=2675229 RepID=UPI0007BFD0D3|nr:MULTISPECIES: signal peptide peptidase SppA [Peribacillus]MBD8134694.1 signal peptide peptidase SppA [Bacillus sp. CFBP 13597]MBT2602078.1 signal peptide peptidase SppA [Bacillus sp. ISL-53]PAW27673.1 signal peptide peptidase SppA [Peribacillus simplex]PEF35486.1 signal peptide peptidase SppA [Bacillus sp. AFS094228]PEO50624.1 signal peptide peptidase SppA [Bacillus sp. AFS026049]PHD78584.1 signal peptide peptidase SppA [Bacillus sp. AFS043905]PRS44315.1 signal peptide peptidase SppA [Bac